MADDGTVGAKGGRPQLAHRRGPGRGLEPASLRDVFGLYGRNEVQKYSGPGGWNDPDYLLLGYLAGGAKTPLSPNEQYSYVSLWCLVAAPLIFSGDITRLDEFTLSLLTNDEVLEVDQDPLGKAALRVAKAGDSKSGPRTWGRPQGRGAVQPRRRPKTTVTVKWSDLGITGKQVVRDLWRQKDLGTFEGQFSAPVGERRRAGSLKPVSASQSNGS